MPHLTKFMHIWPMSITSNSASKCTIKRIKQLIDTHWIFHSIITSHETFWIHTNSSHFNTSNIARTHVYFMQRWCDMQVKLPVGVSLKSCRSWEVLVSPRFRFPHSNVSKRLFLRCKNVRKSFPGYLDELWWLFTQHHCVEN